MATVFGHSIVGLWFYLLQGIVNPFIALFYIVMTNFPDAPVKGWGHDSYKWSHSIFTNLIAWAVISAVILLANLPVSIWLVLVAILSHLFLDCCYKTGGISVFYPLSDEQITMPFAWLTVWKVDKWTDIFEWENLKIIGIEVLSFTPILVLIWLLRR